MSGNFKRSHVKNEMYHLFCILLLSYIILIYILNKQKIIILKKNS